MQQTLHTDQSTKRPATPIAHDTPLKTTTQAHINTYVEPGYRNSLPDIYHYYGPSKIDELIF